PGSRPARPWNPVPADCPAKAYRTGNAEPGLRGTTLRQATPGRLAEYSNHPPHGQSINTPPIRAGGPEIITVHVQNAKCAFPAPACAPFFTRLCHAVSCTPAASLIHLTIRHPA